MDQKKPTYTMSPKAHAVRKAASAKAAKLRPPGRTWRTVRVDDKTLTRIKAQRKGEESLADTVSRLIP